MIWIIVRKEFLLNLVNFRFIAGFILCFMLSVLSAWLFDEGRGDTVEDISGDGNDMTIADGDTK